MDYAHSVPGAPESQWEPLVDHLKKVAALAADHAAAFESAQWGRLAGLWHDLGKYRPEFQRRLRGSGEQVEHAGLGAALAASFDAAGLPLAFVIAGHHAGLANLRARDDTDLTPLLERIDRSGDVLGEVREAIPADFTVTALPNLPNFLDGGTGDRAGAGRRMEFWIRLLFSALVDADRLATEAFCDPDAAKRRRGYPSLEELERRLNVRLGGFRADSPVNKARAAVLVECRRAAALEPGLFSLTAPTGSGKTLSAMAFALAHARRHGLRRVIVVVPYTSIIEQNAAVYREAMGHEAVVEHHSNLDEKERLDAVPILEIRRRLAAENWDAPVIVTTTVQFFESLFSNRPGSCRKLHNIVRSVVILDEAQCLPAGFLACLLDALRDLAERYGCSIVISTATQPALGRRETLPDGLGGVREIIGEPRELARRFTRVRVQWPRDVSIPEPFHALARRLASLERVLAIVHRRADARLLATLLPSIGRFHLSALMCAAHRLRTLEAIRARLDGEGICRVVTTQLVEAGVDLDFPVVYRALAGLDSLAQAAGRCNREGRLSQGEFIVYRAETQPPPGALRIGLEATESLLAEYGDALGLTDPESFDRYFRMFYHRSELDRRGVQQERAELNFASVSRLVRLIEDGYRQPVVVPWGEGPHRLVEYERAPGRETARALQPYLVQIARRSGDRLVEEGRARHVTDDLLALMPGNEALYSEEFGLQVDPGDEPAEPLIV